MELSDQDLVVALAGRDGQIESRWRSHKAGGECPYGELYEAELCPWCVAEQRRPDAGETNALEDGRGRVGRG